MKILDNTIQVTQAFLPPIDEYVDKIKGIWEKKWLTNNGPLHNELQDKLSEYLKVKESTLFVNGHMALDVAIKALNLKGEVITTPFTFASTTHAIVMNNLTPVFCDINPVDYTIDVSKIEDLITDKTSAIIPVHVFGNPCDVEAIDAIAKKHNLKVIYDAAHVFGVEVNGKGIGTFGDISMFSLHATKVYNSIEGGLLTFNDSIHRGLVEKLKNFGISGQESVELVGLNGKMNEFQAAMGLSNLKYIDEQIEKRRKVVNKYREILSGIEGLTYLEDKAGIKHNYSYFPIVINKEITGMDRNELHEELKKYNIFTRKYFYPIVTEFDCYRDKFNNENLDVAKFIADNILVLPLYGELSVTDVEIIGNNIRELLQKNI